MKKMKNVQPKKNKVKKVDIIAAVEKPGPKLVPGTKPKMICPKCGNTFFNILGSKYECMMCAFIGPLVEFYKGYKKK